MSPSIFSYYQPFVVILSITLSAVLINSKMCMLQSSSLKLKSGKIITNVASKNIVPTKKSKKKSKKNSREKTKEKHINSNNGKLTQKQLEKFNRNGYIIIRNCVSNMDSVINYVEKQQRTSWNSYNLFKKTWEDTDEHRKIFHQNTSSSGVSATTNDVYKDILSYFPTYNITQASVITSEKGGEEQCAHIDNFTNRTNNTENIKMSCILSVSGGSKLKIWPQSHTLFDNFNITTLSQCYPDSNIRKFKFDEHYDMLLNLITGAINTIANKREFGKKIKPIYIGLKKGDCIIFLDRLVHAGCGYDRKNTRVYIQLIHKSYPADSDYDANIFIHDCPNSIKSAIDIH